MWSEPIPKADTYYTEGGSNGKAGYVGKLWQTPFHSSQRAELQAVTQLLSGVPESINVVADSQYVWFTVNHIQTDTLSNDNDLDRLVCQLQTLASSRDFPVFITHSISFTPLW